MVLEIVQLRSTSLTVGDLANELAQCPTSPDPGKRVTVFRRIDVPTDVSIHIHHMDSGHTRPSPLGLRLASELKLHGMLLHTLWLEQEIGNGGKR
jgi:hypothetical protein